MRDEGKTAWPALCEMIRRSNNPELCACLDAYQAKLFSGYTTCWTARVRRAIRRRAALAGLIPEGEA